MTTRPRNQSLGEIAGKPAFRIIDGVSIRFVESDPGNTDALLLSPWPESIMAYEPIWLRLAETTHLVAIDPEATYEPPPKPPLTIAEADIGLGCNAAPASETKAPPEGRRFHKAVRIVYGVLGAVGKGVPLS